MMNEPPEARRFLERWLAVLPANDWFYDVDYKGKKYFIVDNGELGYTAMLPDEY